METDIVSSLRQLCVASSIVPLPRTAVATLARVQAAHFRELTDAYDMSSDAASRIVGGTSLDDYLALTLPPHTPAKGRGEPSHSAEIP